jgi:hypothetical protein
VVYVSNRIYDNLRLGGATWRKWRILDGKVESDLISDLEHQGGSPHLCRLRTDRLAPVNKIELCTDAYGLYETTETK